MVTVGNLLSRVETQRVVRVLQATGSRDPDVLHAQKLALLAAAKRPLLVGTVLFVAGIAVSATVTLAPVGIPVALVGWSLRRRGVTNMSNVRDGFAQYLNHHP
jgi:hypothetical protein